MPERRKKKEKDKPIVDEDVVVLQIIEHVDLKKKIDGYTKSRSAITANLKKVLPIIGTMDDKGSLIYTRKQGDKLVIAKNTKRVTSSLVPESVDVLNASKEGKKYVKKQTIDVVNAELLEADVLAGKVSTELVERLFTISETFALTTDIK